MFHVKQRLVWPALAAVAVLLVAACGGAPGSRGWAPPVTSEDLVLLSTRKNHLTAVDTRTHEAVWRFPECWTITEKSARSLGGLYGPPIVSADGRIVFLGDYNGHVYAFPATEYNCGQGEKMQAASVKLEGRILGGIALDATNDTLYVTAGPRLYTLRASDLVARTRNKDAGVAVTQIFEAGGDIWSTPQLNQGRILLTSLDGNFYAVNARTGAEEWRFTAGRSLASTPSVAEGTLALFGGLGDRVHAVETGSGRQRWAFQTSNSVWGSPLVSGGRAYFGDFDGRVYAVDVATGNEAWSIDLGRGVVRGSPALVQGTLVVATESGWLAGIDLATQDVRWQTEIGSGILADLVARNDSVFIAPKGCVRIGEGNQRTYYSRVDPRSGQLTQTSGVC
jgi:outer membrane protein assembly factor BamB